MTFAARQEARDRAIEARVAAERAGLSVTGAIILAIRDHRRRLGLSQRAYAAVRGWSKSFAADIEAQPGQVKLETVLAALGETGFTLALVREPGTPTDGAEAAITLPVHQAVPAEVWSVAEVWSAAELVARDCDGRRLPAHHEPERLRTPHTWWFTRHGYFAADEPLWTWRRTAD